MMKRYKTRGRPVLARLGAGVALLAAVGASGCNLDLTNPNSPPEEVVLTSSEGIIALAEGMQAQYAGTGVGTGMVLNMVRAPALVTDEWSTRTAALAADRSLATGQGVDPSYGVVTSPYYTAFRVTRSANDLLANVSKVGLAQGTQVGITALAKTFKAMALGSIAQQYERIPVDASLEGSPLRPRAEVMDTAIALLESARADLGSVTTAQLAEFRSRVQGSSFDLGNTVNAMLARFYLFRGQYQKAIDAADRVNLGVLSAFTYPDPNRNPIWGYSVSVLYVAGLNTFVTEAEPGDRRPAYWLRTDLATFNGNPTLPLRSFRTYQDKNESFPVYLPDEMRLIKAEALVRLGGAANFAQALTLINQVRTQTSSTLNEPVAGLPAKTAAELGTQDALLRQIAYERRYELYMQGVRWEDLRRFGPAIAGKTPKVAFLPLPQSECLYNPARVCG